MRIHAHKAKDLSAHQIDRQVGTSNNTAARYLNAPEAPKPRQRQAHPTKFESVKSHIERLGGIGLDSAPALLSGFRPHDHVKANEGRNRAGEQPAGFGVLQRGN